MKLEQNYRSTQTILDAANAVISHNRGQMPKHLWTDVGEGDKVRVREMADEFAEARWVTAEIQRLVDEGVSRNGDRRLLPDQRAVAGARGHARAGRGRLPGDRRAEVLRAGRDQGRDPVPHVPGQPAGRDGVHADRELAAARASGRRRCRACSRYAAAMGMSVWEAAEGEVPGLATAARKSLDALHGHDARRCASARRRGRPVAELLDELLDETGYRDALRAERTIEAQGRLENLDELITAARQFDINAPDDGGTLGEFLQQTSLVADADTIRDDEGLVTLMTMHNAKGLEFPIVFMIGMEEGIFPHSRSIEDNQIEEERRLAYVGLTRAMRDLTLTLRPPPRSPTAARPAHSLRSRFLDELPAELTDQAARIARGFPAPGRIASWSARGRRVRRGREQDAQIFHVGDDIVHSAARRGRGHGRRAGRDRRRALRGRVARTASLMADVAPIRKR